MMRPVHSRGFVLVVTLWVMVILGIAAAGFADRVAKAVEQAQQARQNTQALLDLESARAEVLYRLSTTTLTEYGAGRGATALGLDNRPYRVGQAVAWLQDTRGLINLNFGDDIQLNRLLGLLGIAADQRARLIDSLRDYTSANGLRRLSGASRQDYQERGLAPPTNTGLVSPWQARRIIGWRDTPALWDDERFVSLTTATQSAGLNPNTAPADVLATLPGVTAEMAQLLVQRRQRVAFVNESGITQLTTVPLNLPMGMGIIAIPSNVTRLTLWVPGLPWAQQFQLRLTPAASDAPWQVDYFVQVPAPAKADVLGQASELPPRPELAPDLLPAFLRGR